MEDPTEFESLFRQEAASNFWNNHTSKPFVSTLTKHASFSAMAKPVQPAWFDVRVFYVRASSCVSDKAPDSLLIVYPQRNIGAELEVNGGRISPLERACFVLRRDRVDAGAAEATYVSTNNLRTTGDLPFEIYDKDELVIYGTLGRGASTSEYESIKDGHITVASAPCHSNEAGWSMECACGISSHSCFFLKGRMDFSTVNPTMEVYVAGQSCGSPLALTTTVQLCVRKKNLRQSSLDVIPEVEEAQPNQIVARQIAEDAVYAKMDDHPLSMSSFYMPIGGAYIGESEGELSWFNAGVRVGVGIGLGLCLGVGLGVGLLVRPFKRRLL
ncbi:hypothetical protein GOP47_0026148 [Adiantum capillus-veneris]|uniref:Uncharacterized protein n=1 Tax=Adiantum capillus-veneris TaxID=13818 RepID=A0A9D4Z3I1_ADICA|nr:hypothetical protein GOP47_0026148 [Adiantum capillus-veneris]